MPVAGRGWERNDTHKTDRRPPMSPQWDLCALERQTKKPTPKEFPGVSESEGFRVICVNTEA